MNIRFRITNVAFGNMSTGDLNSVELSFTSQDEENRLYINGQVPVTTEEYFACRTMDDYVELVKKYVSERLQGQVQDEPDTV